MSPVGHNDGCVIWDTQNNSLSPALGLHCSRCVTLWLYHWSCTHKWFSNLIEIMNENDALYLCWCWQVSNDNDRTWPRSGGKTANDDANVCVCTAHDSWSSACTNAVAYANYMNLIKIMHEDDVLDFTWVTHGSIIKGIIHGTASPLGLWWCLCDLSNVRLDYSWVELL